MRILAIDPGTTQSAYVMWDGDKEKIIKCGIENNYDLLKILNVCSKAYAFTLRIEMVGHYGTGMPAGKSIFETCIWIGAFLHKYGVMHNFKDYLVLRKTIVTHLCGSTKAKDSNVRQALIDRFGEPGTRKKPGKLYGVKKDIWSALALAVYMSDKRKELQNDKVFKKLVSRTKKYYPPNAFDIE